jgi:hypothetical protein
MTQEQIRFENMKINHEGGWFREYPFKSIGNIMHWIYVYAGLNVADSSTYGDGVVDFFGKRIATFIWDEELKMPIFDFKDGYEHASDQQKIYLSFVKKKDNEKWKELGECEAKLESVIKNSLTLCAQKKFKEANSKEEEIKTLQERIEKIKKELELQ